MRAFAALLLLSSLSACAPQGPFERAGSDIDDAVEDVRERVEDVVEDVEDARDDDD